MKITKTLIKEIIREELIQEGPDQDLYNALKKIRELTTKTLKRYENKVNTDIALHTHMVMLHQSLKKQGYSIK